MKPTSVIIMDTHPIIRMSIEVLGNGANLLI
ncbi:Transcriptional regulator [Escherichia coli]